MDSKLVDRIETSQSHRATQNEKTGELVVVLVVVVVALLILVHFDVTFTRNNEKNRSLYINHMEKRDGDGTAGGRK